MPGPWCKTRCQGIDMQLLGSSGWLPTGPSGKSPSHCEILFSLPNSPQKPLRGSVWSVISVWKVIARRSSTTHDLSFNYIIYVTKKWGTSCTSKVLAKCKGLVWILDCEYEQEIIAMLDTISKIIKWVMNWEIKISLIIWHIG